MPDFADRFWVYQLVDLRTDSFAPNEIKRYSTRMKNKGLKYNPDGSLTFYVQVDAPPAAQRDDWLPAPKGDDFTLYVRAYWPKASVMDGSWQPPAVRKVS